MSRTHQSTVCLSFQIHIKPKRSAAVNSHPKLAAGLRRGFLVRTYLCWTAACRAVRWPAFSMLQESKNQLSQWNCKQVLCQDRRQEKARNGKEGKKHKGVTKRVHESRLSCASPVQQLRLFHTFWPCTLHTETPVHIHNMQCIAYRRNIIYNSALYIYIYIWADAHRRLRRTTRPSISSQCGLESYWMRTCFRNIFLRFFGTYLFFFLGSKWVPGSS